MEADESGNIPKSPTVGTDLEMPKTQAENLVKTNDEHTGEGASPKVTGEETTNGMVEGDI